MAELVTLLPNVPMEKVLTMMKKWNNLPRIKRNIRKDIKEIGQKIKISTQEKIVPPPMNTIVTVT